MTAPSEPFASPPQVGDISRPVVPVDKTGASLGTQANPLYTATAGESLATQRVNAQSGDFVDGAIATLGTEADTAATDSTSNWTAISLLKGLLAQLETGTMTVNASGFVQPVSGTVQSIGYAFNGGAPGNQNFDRLREPMGLVMQNSSLTGGDPVGTSTFTLGSATGLQNNQWVLLTNSSNTAEEWVLTTNGYTAGSTTVNVTTNILNSGHTKAYWNAYGVRGPGANQFLLEGVQPLILATGTPSQGILAQGDKNGNQLVVPGADTFGTSSNLTAATTFSGTPTVSQLAANSSVVLANPGGMASFLAEINVASAFVGTLTFYGLEADGSTLQAISSHQRGTSTIANNTAINTGVALNQLWVGNCAVFKSVYVVCTAFTSGSVAVQLGLSSAPYAVSITNTVPTSIADGSSTTLGAKADTAITDSTTTNSQMSFIKGFVKILADVWDSVNHVFKTDGAALQGPVNISAINGAGTPGATLSATLNASADNTITLASKCRTVFLHNQSSVNVPYEHDITATATSGYLVPGQLAYIDVHTTVLHVYPSNALPINAANGLIVRGWN